MLKSEKEEMIEELNEKFAAGQDRDRRRVLQAGRGDRHQLRKKFREGKVEYKVLKNTLAKRAAKGTPVEVISRGLQGPGGAGHQLRRRGGPGQDPLGVHQGHGDHQDPQRRVEGRQGSTPRA